MRFTFCPLILEILISNSNCLYLNTNKQLVLMKF